MSIILKENLLMANISNKIDELSTSFFELQLVKDYFHQVDLINENEELLLLSDRVKKLQRMMTLNVANKEEHERYKVEYEQKLNEYNAHPYIVNYTYLKNEVEDLLTQIKKIIEIT